MITKENVFGKLILVAIGILLTGCVGGGNAIGDPQSQFEITGLVKGVDGAAKGNIDILASGSQPVTGLTSANGTFVLSRLTDTVRVEAVSDSYVFIPPFIEGITASQNLTFLALEKQPLGEPLGIDSPGQLAFANGLIIELPETAASVEATITVDPATDLENTDGMTTIGPAAAITLTGWEPLNDPIQLSFPGEPPAAEQDYGLFRYDEAEQSWTYFPVQYDQGRFTASINEFSLWVLATAEQVAPVTAQPNSGSFASGTQILLTSTTNEASIYYTLDGTTPSRASLLYDPADPPRIESDTVEIKALAVKGNWIDSLVTTFSYSLQPQLSLTGLPETIAIDESDSVVLTYTVEPAAEVTFSSADPGIASVDNQGLVTGVSPGVTTVTVTASKPGYIGTQETVQVTVSEISGEFAGGDGTSERPFEIATVEHLHNVRNHLTKHFKLINDIVFPADAAEPGDVTGQAGSEWQPIGSNTTLGAFRGTFDGDGFAIENLVIQRPSSSYVGLFGFIFQAQIRNLSLHNIEVQGRNQVGGLAGANTASLIENVHVSGTITGNDQVGGLVGFLRDQNMQSSSFTGSVTGRNQVGGLAGHMTFPSAIEDSDADIQIVGQNMVGGLVGEIRNGVIRRSFAQGTVSGVNDVGGLAGHIDVQDRVVITDGSYAQVDVDGMLRVGGLVGWHKRGTITDSSAQGSVEGRGLATGGLVGQAGSGSSTADVGHIENSFATGDVYGVTVAGGLVGDLVRGSIRGSHSTGNLTGLDGRTHGSFGGLLGRAGNFAQTIEDSFATGNVTATGGTIGGFAGSFGTGVTVTGSYALGDVQADGGTVIGGFVGNNSGQVLDSHAAGQVHGAQQVGGFAGSNTSSGLIEQSYAQGSVSGSLGYTLGGLVGSNQGEIRNSYAVGAVTGGPVIPLSMPHSIGGLVGRNRGIIHGSWAQGAVSGDHNQVGGLVGENLGEIATSFATGDVTGTNGTGSSTALGGLIGANTGTVENSYATGRVLGSGYEQVGGFVGFNTGSITNSFAIGAALGKDKVGGLVGENSQGAITRSYYNQDTAVTNGHGTASTTSLMTFPYGENVYVDWDFDLIWQADEFGENDGYPSLR